jgi:phage tail tape-measure protein
VLGADVGAVLGADVGADVGAVLGAVLGAEVGPVLGAVLGADVGLELGAILGLDEVGLEPHQPSTAGHANTHHIPHITAAAPKRAQNTGSGIAFLLSL